MPSYRIGFGSDFSLNNSNVGIGTTLGRRKLDVVGVSKGDFNITGVSTLTVYGGFVGQKQNISVASTIGFSTSGVGTFVQVTESETGYLSLVGEYNTVSEDIIVDEGKIFEVSVGSTVSPGTLESVSIQSHFSVPDGGSNDRPDQPTEGMVRFNDDLNTLEFYNGIEWRQFTVSGASGRGVFAGGAVGPANSSLIEYINISSTGNAINFGNLTSARRYTTGCASETRGIIHGGTGVTAIDYITIASQGNGISFGTISNNRAGTASASSSTRGLFAGGYQPAVPVNNIEYIQISTLGNPVDFGDLFTGRYGNAGCSSPTRAIFGGGSGPSTAVRSVIDTVIFSSLGNAIQFGNLTQQRTQTASVWNSTRGIFGGGLLSFSPVSYTNTMDYVTLSSFGNASYFGDLTVATSQFKEGASTQIRGVFGGGYTSPGVNINVMSYVTIATTGNAIDFGDLSQQRRALGGFSDSHGGLGGF